MTPCSKLSPNASTHPADVVAAKLILRGLGHYEAPDWGISEYPDRDLFDAIKDFQAKQGLKVDGVINSGGETVQAMAQHLQAMGRNGDTILAHINPAEAELLDRVTDGGSINPLTGLFEFYDYDDGYDGTLDNDTDYGSFTTGGDFDDGWGGSSSGNMGGPDGSGENNNHGSNENGGPGAVDGALSTTSEGLNKGLDAKEQSAKEEGLSLSQKAHVSNQLNKDDEGVFAKSGKPHTNPSSKPSNPDKPDPNITETYVDQAMARCLRLLRV